MKTIIIALVSITIVASAGVVAGGSAGYSLHSGRASEVDAVTGASTQNNVSQFTHHGLGIGAFAELPFLQLEMGVLELRPSFHVTLPGPFLAAGGSVIYRRTSSPRAYRGGLGLMWVSDRRNDQAMNFLSGVLDLGMDLTSIAGMNLGLEAEAAVACLKNYRSVQDGRELDNWINYFRMELSFSRAFLR